MVCMCEYPEKILYIHIRSFVCIPLVLKLGDYHRKKHSIRMKHGHNQDSLSRFHEKTMETLQRVAKRLLARHLAMECSVVGKAQGLSGHWIWLEMPWTAHFP